MAALVQDKDLGFREKINRINSADGLEIRAGWLTGRPKYTVKRGGTAVAKVAGVQFGFVTLGKLWDQHERQLDRMIALAERAIVDKNKDAQREITKIGIWQAKKIKARVRKKGLVDEGVLIGEIKVGLYARAASTKTRTGFGRPRLVGIIEVPG